MRIKRVITGFQEIRNKAARARNEVWPNYVFIHINKTAGSSVERVLRLRFEHKTAREKRAELGHVKWRSAFKFSFVRNPWDKVVSHYHFRVKTNQTDMGDGHISFGDWVRAAYRDHNPEYYDQPLMFAPQADWLTDENGQIIVDFIGRFESLQEDFSSLAHVLGCPMGLPHLKSSAHHDFRVYYDADSWDVVAEHFREDCRLFGYSSYH